MGTHDEINDKIYNYLESKACSNNSKWYQGTALVPLTDGKTSEKTYELNVVSRRTVYYDRELDTDAIDIIGHLIYESWSPDKKQDSCVIPSTLFNVYKAAALEAGWDGTSQIDDKLQLKREYFEALARSAVRRNELKHFNIFQKKYLFFQKHMYYGSGGHWLLIVVKNPKYIFKDPENPNAVMEVAVFESLRVANEDLRPHVKEVVNFLQGWTENKHFLAGSVFKQQYIDIERNLDSKGKLRFKDTYLNKIPHQHNDKDCGPYTLLYLEKFWHLGKMEWKNKEPLVIPIRDDFSKIDESWFPPMEAFTARRRWRELIDSKCHISIEPGSKKIATMGEAENVDLQLVCKKLSDDTIDHHGKTDGELLEMVGYLPTYKEVQSYLFAKEETRKASQPPPDHKPIKESRKLGKDEIKLQPVIRKPVENGTSRNGPSLHTPRRKVGRPRLADRDRHPPPPTAGLTKDELFAWQLHYELNSNINRLPRAQNSSKMDSLLSNLMRGINKNNKTPNVVPDHVQRSRRQTVKTVAKPAVKTTTKRKEPRSKSKQPSRKSLRRK